MVGRLRLLAQRVAARHAAPVRAGGLRLAQTIAAARRPERIVESATRLARGRSIGAARQAARIEEPLPRPAGMSEFAARWIFGDGPPEGIPIAGEAAMADLVPSSERPSFLVERDEQDAQSAEHERERRSQPVPRGQIEEVRPTAFRLARKPAAAPPKPAADAEPIPLPSRPPPEPPPAAHEEPAAAQASVGTPEPEAERTAAPAFDPAPPVADAPPPPPAATPGPEPKAQVPKPPETAASAPAPPQAPQPAPVPRAKVTVARARAEEEPARPTLHVQRREEPARVEQPAATPAVSAAPAQGFLRRAVDAVLQREPKTPEPPVPLEAAPFQRGPEEGTFSPADTASQVSAAGQAPSTPVPPRPQPAPQSGHARRGVEDNAPAPPPAETPIQRVAAPPEAPAPAARLEETPVEEETPPAVEAPLGDVEAPNPEPMLLEASEPLEPERPRFVPAPTPAEERASSPRAVTPVEPSPAPVRPAYAPRTVEPSTAVPPIAEPVPSPPKPGPGAILRRPVRAVARVLDRAAQPGPERGAEQTPDRPLEAPATLIHPVVQQPVVEQRLIAQPAAVEAPAAEALTARAPVRAATEVQSAPRPALRLVTPARAPAPPILARTEAPPRAARPLGVRTAPTSASRLAVATRGTVASDDGEVQTVVFPRPADRAFASAAALMRAPEEETPAAAEQPAPPSATTTTTTGPAAPAPAPPPGASAGGAGGDIEEIYDQVMQRLRRDLLADRERMGDMLGDLP